VSGDEHDSSRRIRSADERERVCHDAQFGGWQSPGAGDGSRRRIVMFPVGLGIDAATVTRDWLDAGTIEDVVTASGGLYAPPCGQHHVSTVSILATCHTQQSKHEQFSGWILSSRLPENLHRTVAQRRGLRREGYRSTAYAQGRKLERGADQRIH
jgi:hypothetical protein